jgi:hypothetical protein
VSVLETLGELPKRLGGGFLLRVGEPKLSGAQFAELRAPKGSGA